MSIQIQKTILAKINRKEYELLMYIRREGIDITRFSPGNLVFHYNDQCLIAKHEEHISRRPKLAGDFAKENGG